MRSRKNRRERERETVKSLWRVGRRTYTMNNEQAITATVVGHNVTVPR